MDACGRGRGGANDLMSTCMKRYIRVLEAVAAARAPEELIGEADVAAHGADGGGAGHGDC